MGLGKTIQLLAGARGADASGRDRLGRTTALRARGLTLLIVPMSVVPNWLHEAAVHARTPRAGAPRAERLTGERLLNKAIASDVVVTTYAPRTATATTWPRCRGDAWCSTRPRTSEPVAKQTRAIRRSTPPQDRATGTPVENRLGELWSIMDFLNEGYLGTTGDFPPAVLPCPSNATTTGTRDAAAGSCSPLCSGGSRAILPSSPTCPRRSRQGVLLPRPEQATLYQTCVSDAQRRRQVAGHPAPRPGARRAHQAQADLQPPGSTSSGSRDLVASHPARG